jgi:exportin-7
VNKSTSLLSASPTRTNTPNSSNMELIIKEGQLAWLVYIIGGVIGGRSTFNMGNNEEHDLYDGELVVRVLQLMNFINSRLEQTNGHVACEKLDLAVLNFFEQFRKIFIGDQVQKGSKVYRRMSEVLGIQDETMLLNVLSSKIITNLKYWTRSERIINKTLGLLNELSIGYSSVRKLMKLDSIHFMLANHTSDNFPFLGYTNPHFVKEMKCRTTFYTALGRLLNLDFSDDDDTFDRFIRPLSNQLDAIGNLMSQSNNPMNIAEVKLPIVGLARDLRGLAFAFNSRAGYMQLFDWLYPRYLPLFSRALEYWYNEPFVTTPILKLMAELVQNRSQRLTFEISSPNGILLFREASRLLCTYGSRIVNLQVSNSNESNGTSGLVNSFLNKAGAAAETTKDKVYPLKLKGISICFNILKWSLSGGYVNFGVFQLYNDTALSDALQTFVKMLLSFQQNDLVVYAKLSQTYYGLLETLTADHMSFISMLEPQVFLYILSTISEGLSSLDSIISTSCCSALDHVITFLFKLLTKQKRVVQQSQQQQNTTLLQVYQQQPQVFQQILTTVINIIIFEDCRNQWSMSRPLLGLILLNEQVHQVL